MRSSHRVSQQPPRNALQRRNSAARSSAVGSAPRSGRGGRAFESPLLDKKGHQMSFFCRGSSPPSGFLSRQMPRTIIAYLGIAEAIYESPLLDKKGQGCPFFVMVMYAESPINHL